MMPHNEEEKAAPAKAAAVILCQANVLITD